MRAAFPLAWSLRLSLRGWRPAGHLGALHLLWRGGRARWDAPSLRPRRQGLGRPGGGRVILPPLPALHGLLVLVSLLRREDERGHGRHHGGPRGGDAAEGGSPPGPLKLGRTLSELVWVLSTNQETLPAGKRPGYPLAPA